MVEMERIRRFSSAIGERFSARQVILFGSYAAGGATEASDVDLLVVLPHEGSGLAASGEIIRELRPTFPVDLIVRSPSELQERLQWDDPFLKGIVDNGVVLYDQQETTGAGGIS